MSEPVRITVEQEIEASPERVWAALRRLDGAATPTDVIPGLHREEIEGRIHQRFDFAPDAWLRTRVEHIDDDAWTVRTTLVACEGLPIERYALTIRVLAGRSGAVVRFDAELACSDAADAVAGMIRGLYALAIDELESSCRDRERS